MFASPGKGAGQQKKAVPLVVAVCAAGCPYPLKGEGLAISGIIAAGEMGRRGEKSKEGLKGYSWGLEREALDSLQSLQQTSGKDGKKKGRRKAMLADQALWVNLPVADNSSKRMKLPNAGGEGIWNGRERGKLG